MPGESIIVIEDEPDIREVLVYNLQREGFVVSSASSGAEGLELSRQERPDLVLLDLLLPGLDGLDVCRLLRTDPQTSAIPIIMVTAKGEESDVVVGLGVGADDYITKPFSPRELVARVKAVLRRERAPDPAPSPRLVRGPLVIDPDRHRVTAKNRRIDCTPTEFRLLEFLATHPGRVFSRDQLISKAIGESAVVIDRNIDVHIRSLRKKLGPDRGLIETVRGVGYSFRDDYHEGSRHSDRAEALGTASNRRLH